MHSHRRATLSSRLLGVVALGAALGSTLGPREACAQSEALFAARRELLDQATAAARSGQHEQAVELAVRASRIQMSLSLRVFFAEEYTVLGNHAAAYGSSVACLSEASRDASTPNRALIVERCRALLASSRTHVVVLTVHPPAGIPAQLSVRVNDAPLPVEFYGLPYFVTEGAIVVEARAPGRQAFRWEQSLRGGSEARVDLAMPADGSAPAPVSSSRRARSSRSSRGVNGGAVALIALGGALELGAVAFAALYFDARSACPFDPADARDVLCATQDAADRADRTGLWVGLGWGSFATGLLAAGAGLGWLLGSRAGAPRAPVEMQPVLGGGATGLAAQGRF